MHKEQTLRRSIKCDIINMTCFFIFSRWWPTKSSASCLRTPDECWLLSHIFCPSQSCFAPARTRLFAAYLLPTATQRRKGRRLPAISRPGGSKLTSTYMRENPVRLARVRIYRWYNYNNISRATTPARRPNDAQSPAPLLRDRTASPMPTGGGLLALLHRSAGLLQQDNERRGRRESVREVRWVHAYRTVRV
jgi:hypothetical protein